MSEYFISQQVNALSNLDFIYPLLFILFLITYYWVAGILFKKNKPLCFGIGFSASALTIYNLYLYDIDISFLYWVFYVLSFILVAFAFFRYFFKPFYKFFKREVF